MGNTVLQENVETVEKKDFYQRKESVKYYSRSIFPDGVNSYDLKSVIEHQILKDYYLFALEGSKLVFSKAPVRGNTPYGFWIDQRLEEITGDTVF